jgi:hypothetical protein
MTNKMFLNPGFKNDLKNGGLYMKQIRNQTMAALLFLGGKEAKTRKIKKVFFLATEVMPREEEYAATHTRWKVAGSRMSKNNKVRLCAVLN